VNSRRWYRLSTNEQANTAMDKNVRAAEDPWAAVVNTRAGTDKTSGGDSHRGAASATRRAYVAVGFCGRTARVRSPLLVSCHLRVPSRPVHPFHLCVAAGVVSPDSMPQQTRKPQATSTCTSINALRTEAAVGGARIKV
jgi:hypothetical protein